MKLLLVEDDPLVARSVRRLLRWQGHDAVIVSDAHEAIAALKAEPFHAILADLGLPNGVSGRAVLEWAREHRPEVRRILVSAATGRAGADDPSEAFLGKPFDDADLARALAG